MLSMEQEAASTAAAVVALSRSDAKYIEDNLLLPEALCRKVTVSTCTQLQTLCDYTELHVGTCIAQKQLHHLWVNSQSESNIVRSEFT